MALPEYNEDHVIEVLDRLTSQFRQKPNFQGWFRCVSGTSVLVTEASDNAFYILNIDGVKIIYTSGTGETTVSIVLALVELINDTGSISVNAYLSAEAEDKFYVRANTAGDPITVTLDVM